MTAGFPGEGRFALSCIAPSFPACVDCFDVYAPVTLATAERVWFDIPGFLSAPQSGRVDLEEYQHLFAGEELLGCRGFGRMAYFACYFFEDRPKVVQFDCNADIRSGLR